MKPALLASLVFLVTGCVSISHYQKSVKEARAYGLNQCESYLKEDLSKSDVLYLILGLKDLNK